SLKPRREAAVVVWGQVFEAPQLPGEEASPEGAIGDEADPELPAGGEDAVLLPVAAPERGFALHGGPRVDRVRPTERLGSDLRAADPAHLPLAHELRHRAHRLLDRRRGRHAMQVVEVDRLDAEPPQTPLARRARVLGPSVNGADRAILGAHDA